MNRSVRNITSCTTGNEKPTILPKWGKNWQPKTISNLKHITYPHPSNASTKGHQPAGKMYCHKELFLQSTHQENDRPLNQPAQSSTKLHLPSTSTQQHPPPDCLTGVLAFILTFGLSLAAVAGPIRFFISAAIVTKACSTLVALFALVSRNGMRNWSAYSCSYQHCTVTDTSYHYYLRRYKLLNNAKSKQM